MASLLDGNFASDVANAGAALAGLTLVFLGHTAATYHGHPTHEKPAVWRTYRNRGWLVFLGFVLSLAASLLALIGEGKRDECLVWWGGVVLGAAFIVVLVAALHTIRGIR